MTEIPLENARTDQVIGFTETRGTPSVVNVVGGLGNQLFQYLFGLALARATGRPTVYDVSDFAAYGLHGGLTIETYFNLALPRATSADIDAFGWPAGGYNRKRAFAKLAPYLGPLRPFQTDETFRLEALEPTSPSAYYRGYWHSQPYCSEDVVAVRQALVFSDDIEQAAALGLAQLDPDLSRSAAIQIRRGDYASAGPRSPHYPLPLAHYYRAMDRLADEGIDRFYIFSDDINGVRSELNTPHAVTLVDGSISSSAGSDFRLLTRFANLVVSNSTFGWWVAALRETTDGQVIVPRPWLNPAYPRPDLAPPPLDGWRVQDVPFNPV